MLSIAPCCSRIPELGRAFPHDTRILLWELRYSYHTVRHVSPWSRLLLCALIHNAARVRSLGYPSLVTPPLPSRLLVVPTD